jgi:hypothetical protein
MFDGRQCSVARLRNLQVMTNEDKASQRCWDGTYSVSGGLGGLGLVAAGELIIN